MLLLAVLLLTADAHAGGHSKGAPQDDGAQNASGCAAAPQPQVPNLSCAEDTDCAVGWLSNCCGGYEVCVSADYASSDELLQERASAVRQRCAACATGSICGWAAIDRCRCVSGACQGEQDSSGADGALVAMVVVVSLLA